MRSKRLLSLLMALFLLFTIAAPTLVWAGEGDGDDAPVSDAGEPASDPAPDPDPAPANPDPAPVVSGSGDDQQTGGSGDDQLTGDNGDDQQTGDNGDNQQTGDNGDDQQTGDDGDDQQTGDSGDDQQTGDSGDDQQTGDDGDDQQTGDDGDDQQTGDDGDDQQTGDSGDDQQTGDDGDDQQTGDSGDAQLTGDDSAAPMLRGTRGLGEGEPTLYAITTCEHVTASPASAAEGAEVTLTVDPDYVHLLEGLTVTQDGTDTILPVTDGVFTMPAGDVTVYATFASAKASMGSVLYMDLSDALIYAATDGTSTTITLCADDTINYVVSVDTNKNVTLNLGGCTLNAQISVDSGSALTVTGSGTIACGSGDTITVAAGGALTVNGGTVANNAQNASCCTVNSSGTLTVNGGTVTRTNAESAAYAIVVAGGETTINSGTVSGCEGSAVRVDSGATLTLASGFDHDDSFYYALSGAVVNDPQANPPDPEPTCEHPNAVEQSGWLTVEYEYVDACQHIARGTLYTQQYCPDCETTFNYSESQETIYEPHIWNGGNTCPCGAYCAHDDTNEQIFWIEETGYTDKGMIHHVPKGRYVLLTVCSYCNAELGRSEEITGDAPDNYLNNHVYEGSNVCTLCGHVNTCEHPNALEQSGWKEITSCVYANFKEHTVTGTFFTQQYCPDCEIVFGRSEEQTTGTNPHGWSEEGYCYECNTQNPCPHENTYITIGWVNQEGCADRGDYHVWVGTYIQYTYCQDCGQCLAQTEQTGDGPDRIDHYYVNGVCECGHENPCQHLNAESENIQWLGEPTITPVDDREHTISGPYYTQRWCPDCCQWIDYTEHPEGRTETQSHNYVDGVCTVCGHANTCEHTNSMLYYYWVDDSEEHPCVDVGDNWGHGREGWYYIQRFCYECGQTIVVSEEEYGPLPGTYGGYSREQHDYDENHTCTICGHVNTCPHNAGTGRYVTEIEGTDRYSDVYGDASHMWSYDAIIENKCYDCGESITGKKRETVSYSSQHEWDENGVCTLCGHVNACPHPDGEMELYYIDPSQNTVEEKPGDHLYHWVIGPYYTLMRCPDCHLEYSRQEHLDKVQAELQEHVYEERADGTIVCTVCGHVNTCPHELEAREAYDWWGESTCVPIDNLNHRTTGEHIFDYHCLDCGWYWRETRQDECVETHEYVGHVGLSGYCHFCDYTNNLTLIPSATNIELKVGESATLTLRVEPPFTEDYEYVDGWSYPDQLDAVSMSYPDFENDRNTVVITAYQVGQDVLQMRAWDDHVVSCTVTVRPNDAQKVGENLTWAFDEQTGTLTISGQGAMYAYHNDWDYQLLPPWQDKIEAIRALVLPAGITNVSWSQLGSLVNLESISITEGESLYRVVDNVLFSTDGELIFYPPNRPGTSYTAPAGTVKIGDSAFRNHKLLQTVILPEGVTDIGNHAFSGCAELTSITLPSTLKRIDKYAFIDSEKLSAFTLPEGLEYIGYCAFARTAGPENLIVPAGTDFSWSAFEECTGIVTVRFKGDLNCDEDHYFAFDRCPALTTVIFDEGVTGIPEGIFDGCENLSSVTIPDSVEFISGYAFDGCKKLTALPTMNGVKSIGPSAFANTGLSGQLVIPASVKTIGIRAFSGCRGITGVTLPQGLETLGGYGNTGITSINIPDTVTTIGEDAFIECKSLTEITLPDSIIDIQDEAFYSCSSLTNVTIPRNVENIGDRAFSRCTNLQTLTLPLSLKTFGELKAVNNLQTVNYAGTKEQKNSVIMDWRGRFELRKATWVYTYTGYDVSVSENEDTTTVAVETGNDAATSAALPADAFVANVEERKPVAVQTETAQITFDAAAANAILGNAGATDLQLELTAEEGANNTKTLNIEMTANQVEVFANGTDGTATVTVPYALEAGCVPEVNLVVDGVRTPVTVVDWTSNSVTFIVEHFSTYEFTQRTAIAIDAATFPDEVFRTYVAANFDTDHDGILSAEEIAAVTVIDLSDAYQNPDDPGGEYTYANCVATLAGIGAFPNLEELSCDPFTFGVDGHLTGVDLSGNTKLKVVDLGCNQLTALDVTMLPDLEELSVGFTNLTSIDLSHNANLKKLLVDDAKLSALDLTHNPLLAALDCCGNDALEFIDLDNCAALKTDYLAGELHFPDLPYLTEDIHVYGNNSGGEGQPYRLAINTHVKVKAGAPFATNQNPVASANAYYENGDLMASVTGVTIAIGNHRLAADEAVYRGNYVTVTAPRQPGYTFKGWFKGDTKVCDNLAYAFPVMEGGIQLEAQYMVNGSATVTISTGNDARFTVNDSTTQQSLLTESYRLGTELTLTAVEPERVLQWENGSNKVMGRTGTLKVTVTGAMTIKLVYKAEVPTGSNQSYVQFLSDYGQVLLAKAYSTSDAIERPAAPTKFGYTFVKWVFEGTEDEATVETIKAKLGVEGTITVKPMYTKDATTYTLTVVYDGVAHENDVYNNISIGTGYSVSVADQIGEKVFQHWKLGDTIVSYKTDYYLQVAGNVTLTAVYGENAPKVIPVITMGELSKVDVDGVHKVTGTATRSIPDGYTLIEHGILYGKDFDTPTAGTFVIGATGVKQYISNTTMNNGTVKLNVKVANDDIVVTFRGYMILKNNSTGNVEEPIYSNIRSGSYNAPNPQA